MLLYGTLAYLVLNVLVGLWAARRVKNAEDFLLAGRSLGLGLTTATIFATWFGSETVMGASSQMAQYGLYGVVEDPFGAAFCLLLLGAVFARPLYRMNLLTFGDFYRDRFGPLAERVASVMLVISYLGWVAAQFVALGLIGEIMLGLPLAQGIWMGASVVVLYTFMGGMWSVAVLDMLQNTVIVAGLVATLLFILPDMQLDKLTTTLPPGYFRFTPQTHTPVEWLNYLAAWITIGLGSLPQQDLFQRVNAARNAQTAARGAYIGAALYLTVGLIPLVVAVHVRVNHPELLQADSQTLVLHYLLQQTPLALQLLFMGALISAIMSTASGALLAPSAILTENLLKRIAPDYVGPRLLLFSRLSVLAAAAASLALALGRSNIFELVGESSAISLVSLFVPFVFGLFAPRHSFGAPSALLSMVAGFGGWFVALQYETLLSPLVWGLVASLAGWFVAQLQRKKKA